jgi:hypothetical protein
MATTPAAPPEPSAPTATSASAPPVPAKLPIKRTTLGATAFASFTARVLLVIAGAGFVVGFFFPWFRIAGAASSGLNLLTLQGDAVDFMSWPQRLLIFSVPMFGTGLLVAGFIGHRIALWLALAASVVVIGGGAYTLLKVFFGSTGTGMWIVVGCALLSLSVAMLTLGRTSRK